VKKVLQYIVLEDFFKALTNIGYKRIFVRELTPVHNVRAEYRKESFHVIIHRDNRKITINLHIDIRNMLKKHIAIQKSKKLRNEWKKIMYEYRKVRSNV